MFTLMNPYVAKITIAARDGDSIRAISKKIKESYGWTYKWVLELEKTGAMSRKGQKVYINKKNTVFKALSKCVIALAAQVNLHDAYLIPQLIGLNYAFTDIDAVFIWTQGGYNIGRNRNAYPIFIEILKQDKAAWEAYLAALHIRYTFKNERKKGIYFVISLSEKIEKEYCGDIPVLPLTKTVAWAKEYSFNFQPALEMLDKMYHLQLGVSYAEPW